MVSSLSSYASNQGEGIRRPHHDIPRDLEERRALRFRQDAGGTERLHLIDERPELVHRRLGLSVSQLPQRALELDVQRIALTVVQHAVRHQTRDVMLEKRNPLRQRQRRDRKSTRLNSSHLVISYAVFC